MKNHAFIWPKWNHGTDEQPTNPSKVTPLAAWPVLIMTSYCRYAKQKSYKTMLIITLSQQCKAFCPAFSSEDALKDEFWIRLLSELCFPHSQLGKVDRGCRPGGSFPEPRADEEQPLGGERKVRPPLEKAVEPSETSCDHRPDHHIPSADPLTWPLSRTQPANVSPWMYNMPLKLSTHAMRTKKYTMTETHTHVLRPQMFFKWTPHSQ